MSSKPQMSSNEFRFPLLNPYSCAKVTYNDEFAQGPSMFGVRNISTPPGFSARYKASTTHNKEYLGICSIT